MGTKTSIFIWILLEEEYSLYNKPSFSWFLFLYIFMIFPILNEFSKYDVSHQIDLIRHYHKYYVEHLFHGKYQSRLSLCLILFFMFYTRGWSVWAPSTYPAKSPIFSVLTRLALGMECSVLQWIVNFRNISILSLPCQIFPIDLSAKRKIQFFENVGV